MLSSLGMFQEQTLQKALRTHLCPVFLLLNVFTALAKPLLLAQSKIQMEQTSSPESGPGLVSLVPLFSSKHPPPQTMLTNLTLLLSLSSGCTYGKTKVQRGEVTSPKSHS